MGWQNAFHCEIDDFCNTILNYWFKDAKSYTDVTTTDFREWRGNLLQSLMQSPDTQRLMELLSQNAGDGLKTAAAKGDTGALLGMVRQVMQSSEGARLVQNISQAVPKEKK